MGTGRGTGGGGIATIGGTPMAGRAAVTATTGGGTTNPPLPNLRVGGVDGQQDNPWWTGGSNLVAQRSVCPKRVMEYCPPRRPQEPRLHLLILH